MKLENQVCSLEQAKRLKELGITQIGLFCINEYENHTDTVYADNNDNPQGILGRWMGEHPLTDFKSFGPFVGIYSAYTVAELGVMLPEVAISVRQTATQTYGCILYKVGSTDVNYEVPIQNKPTEAQSRAAMAIYLLENGYITAEDCNKRLTA